MGAKGMATTNGFDTANPPRKMKTSSDSSEKTPWARAVSVPIPALILALCLTAFPSAPTWADAEVPDGVFYDTIPGMAVADARRAENPGGGGWFRINELHVK
jgi:hypothetical protein